MVVIVDFGMGNLNSVAKTFKLFNYFPKITSKKEDIISAKKIILPGIGHYATGMSNLKKSGLLEVLYTCVMENKIPVLGICLGMQIMTEWGEEGQSSGLGWVKGKTIRFSFAQKNRNLKIPHIGWNTIHQEKKNNLLKKIGNESFFYFAHSYYLQCEEKNDILATSQYGFDFTSVIQKNNIYGVQFHPEKSHKAGLQLLKNFIENS